MNRLAKALVALALAVGLTGVQPRAARAAVGGAAVEVPVILPVTGPGAFIGATEQQGLQILEQRVNATGGVRNRPLKFVFYDDQGNPANTVQLFNTIVAKGAQVVIGASFSGLCKALMPLVTPTGPVLYCISPAVRPAPGGYVFSASIHPLDLIAAGLRFFKQKGWNRIALLIGTDATGQEVDQNLETILARPGVRGIQIVAHEHYNTNDVTAAAQVSRIQAQRPDAVVVWSATGMATPLHALSDAGSNAPVLLCNAVQTYTAMQQFATFLPKQLYFAVGKWGAYPNVGTGPVKDAIREFYDAFKAAGIKPDLGHENAWDPGVLVVEALRQVGPDAKAPQIHAFLENLHGFVSSNGYYDFRTGDQRGLNPNDIVISIWDPKKEAWTAASVQLPSVR